MKVRVQVDQAVWERCDFYVDVPDGLEGDELKEAIAAEVESYDQYGSEEHQQYILDEAVEGIDIQRNVFLPDGTELEI